MEFVTGRSAKTEKRILILGESHYDEDKEIASEVGPYYTSEVLKCFLNARKHVYWHNFFKRIADSFGYKESRQDFYDKVYFGNYVTVFCGKNSDVAKKAIKENRVEYNNRVFSFINDNKIDVLVCFSKTVYYALPDANDGDQRFEPIIVSPENIAQRRTIEKYLYKEGVRHRGCEEILEKPLLVYGVNHPSGSYGFSADEIYDAFKKEEAFAELIKPN